MLLWHNESLPCLIRINSLRSAHFLQGTGLGQVIYVEAVRGRLQRTSGKWGGGGGFEISDIPGRGGGGWFVKVRTSENF